MARWDRSVMRPGTFVAFNLLTESDAYPRVEPSADGWLMGCVGWETFVVLAGPFPTREQAMLAAELMFE